MLEFAFFLSRATEEDPGLVRVAKVMDARVGFEEGDFAWRRLGDGSALKTGFQQ